MSNCRRVARLVALPSLLAFAAACPASSEEVQPEPDQFYFPTGVKVSGDERYLFVTNANSDLRFDSGSLMAVDLDAVEERVEPWVSSLSAGSPAAPAGCTVDPDLRETILCDESPTVVAAVRVGNFAGEVGIQQFADGTMRVFLPSRGDPSITWVDFDPAANRLSCASGTESFPRCDDAHRLNQLRNDPDDLPLTEEPFGLFVDGDNGYAIVSHLTTGNVSLLTAPTDGSAPIIADVKGGFFSVNPNTGARGAVGVAGRSPGDPNDVVYITSRVESRVQLVHVEQPDPDRLPFLVPTDFFFVDAVLPTQESRGITFSQGGNRAHVVSRNAPALITVDTSLDDTGRPRNEVLNGVETCRSASVVALVDSGEGERAYVSCFRDGQIWVIEPTRGVLEAIIAAGRGPTDVAASPSRKRVYVSNFVEDTIAVIDTTPGAVTENRVVMRIGIPNFRGDE